MTNSLMTISIVDNTDGSRDVEIIDGEVTDSFVDGLSNAYLEGRITGFEIRTGFPNGGDSRIEYTHNG